MAEKKKSSFATILKDRKSKVKRPELGEGLLDASSQEETGKGKSRRWKLQPQTLS